MQRREMLATSSAAILGLSTFPFGWSHAAEKKKQKILYFTRSVEFEHSVVAPDSNGRSHSGNILIDLGKEAGFEVAGRRRVATSAGEVVRAGRQSGPGALDLPGRAGDGEGHG